MISLRIHPFFCLVLCIILLAGCKQDANPQSKSSLKLWYKSPAQSWEEALPIGNGRIGVMIYGGPVNEHLQLNDDSLWPGDPEEWDDPEGRPADLQKIRELLINGENQEADSLFVDKFSNKSVGRSHQTLGDLKIRWDHTNVSNYRRELDLTTAVSRVSYQANGHQVEEVVFASHPDQAIVMEVTTDAPAGLNGTFQLSRPMDEGHPTASVKAMGNNTLVMTGEITQYGGAFRSKPFPITTGVKFETRLSIDQINGEVTSGGDQLVVNGAKTLRLVIVSNSDYYFEDYKKQNQSELEQVQQKSTDELLSAHINDYKSYYNRASLNIAKAGPDTLSTLERLNLVRAGATDLWLETVLFQYGRYLLISSSRPGTNPANLQGLWNPHIMAPWNGDYHLNINLQMNYWLANLTNLDELNEPLFDYIDRLVANGHETARTNFGMRGSFIPHATDLWAPTWLRAPTAYWGCSVGGGGWLMQHYWQHVLFTQDTSFLKERAFPAMHEVAQFYSDWLIEDPRDGYLVSAPSTSPENRFVKSDGAVAATCMGSAMDQQIIHEVFSSYLQACEWLGINNELQTTIQSQLPKLRPGFVLGDDGRILEWDRSYEEHEPGHRHMSHLYEFHPGTAVNKTDQPELFEAVQKTLDHRLAHGGAGTGWSRAWLINLSARLGNGNMAHEHINLLFQKSMYNNLFDSHPPFQIDGNFGFTAGICEMLVQSHAGYIDLLPALPKAYPSGSFTGLKVRGNGEVSAFWENSDIASASLIAKGGGTFRIKNPAPGSDPQFFIGKQKKTLPEENGIYEVTLNKGDLLEMTF